MPHDNGQTDAAPTATTDNGRPNSILYRQGGELVSAAGGPATEILVHRAGTRSFDVVQSAVFSFDELSSASTDVTLEVQYRRSPDANNIIRSQITFTLDADGHRQFIGGGAPITPGQILRPDHAVRVTVLHDSGSADVNVDVSLVLARFRSDAARSLSQR